MRDKLGYYIELMKGFAYLIENHGLIMTLILMIFGRTT